MTYDPDKHCGGTTRAGTPCEREKGWGCPDHVGFGNCKLHGGLSPNGQKFAHRQMAGAAVVTFGLPVDVAPELALAQELARTNGHVTWLAELVSALERDELKQYTKDKGLLWEKPSVWLELYQGERKHLTTVAKVCVDVGVAERQTRVQEQQIDVIQRALDGYLAEQGVELDREGFARHLRLVEGTG